MKRRKFIRSLSLCVGTTLTYGWAENAWQSNPKVTFGISADIHNDIIHDGESRLGIYLTEMERRRVDLIIDMGDFCHPVKENEPFLKLWKSSSLPRYNLMGNHDMDLGTKQDFMEFVGMKSRYYSFDRNGFHFCRIGPEQPAP